MIERKAQLSHAHVNNFRLLFWDNNFDSTCYKIFTDNCMIFEMIDFPLSVRIRCITAKKVGFISKQQSY